MKLTFFYYSLPNSKRTNVLFRVGDEIKLYNLFDDFNVLVEAISEKNIPRDNVYVSLTEGLNTTNGVYSYYFDTKVDLGNNNISELSKFHIKEVIDEKEIRYLVKEIKASVLRVLNITLPFNKVEIELTQ